MNRLRWAIIRHVNAVGTLEYHMAIVTKLTEDKITYLPISKNHSNPIMGLKTNEIEIITPSEIAFNNCIDDIKEYYAKMIQILKAQLRVKNITEYADEKTKTYVRLKTQINATAQHMIDAMDDYDFENKLKAICELKKRLYTIENEKREEDCKFNGGIMYKIRETQEELDRKIKYFTESFEMFKNYV